MKRLMAQRDKVIIITADANYGKCSRTYMELGHKWNLNPVLLIIGFVFSIVLLPLKLAVGLLALKINFIF